MFGIGRLLGSIFEGLSYLASAVVENPKNAAFVVVGAILLAGSASVGYLIGQNRRSPETSTTPLRRGKYPKSLSDLLRGTPGASAPSGALYAPVPDTGAIDTVKIRVPKYIVKRDTVTNTRIASIRMNPARYESPSLSLETSLQSSPYKFLVLPTIDGRPAVNVNSERTKIDAFDPRGGSSVKLTYQHPKDIWGLGPSLLSRITWSHEKVNSTATLGGFVRYKRFKLNVGNTFSSIDGLGGVTFQTRIGYDITDL